VADKNAEFEINLRVVLLDHPEGRNLERMHLDELRQRYGERGPTPLPNADFEPPKGCFVLALAKDTAVGCGGFRHLRPEVAEIKRMFVNPDFRNRGIAHQILAFLENRAHSSGYREAWLETGTEQPEAIALYTSVGYSSITPYGEFRHDARSRCFSRLLDN
jgi:GNAT superfamily N-acetyltransferase